ncbi:hypothetical protein DFH08DRAFT_973458 [Mycena albidolilacea]|uniref:Uncharacterized protein n=1 Tax=Mycena albidolilacea TaxID=1033008 RepID=A0AAD6Z8N8_9AGAR|nr:hypothetical protein DFH08DRAFT_973458 [Mycena albidolilacea]
MTKDDLPKQWPKHFPTAIRILNNRILPSIKFTPKEILFGMLVSTRTAPVADTIGLFTVEDVAIHMVYVEQQQLDGYAGRVEYALGHKVVFDWKVLASFYFGITTPAPTLPLQNMMENQLLQTNPGQQQQSAKDEATKRAQEEQMQRDVMATVLNTAAQEQCVSSIVLLHVY